MSELTPNVSGLWILLSAALVFFMQAGFTFLEIGLVRKQNVLAISIKNVLDWMICLIIFSLIGFGLMFGTSSNTLFGTSLFALEGLDDLGPDAWIFFLFQLTFAATACTILSGAIAGRTSHFAYIISVIVVAMLVYPVFGFWVWGSALVSENAPWLSSMGFHDFAGSAVVHAIGAWCGLAGALIVGPRIGWLDESGNPRDFETPEIAWSFVGVLILWLGWWGFNGGSVGAFDSSVGKVIMVTNLAAACAGFSSLLHARIFGLKSSTHIYLIGGIITGLVAITASADIATPLSACVLGLIAGIAHNIGLDFIKYNLRIDDPVGAVTVHGIGGTLGIMAVPFVANPGTFENLTNQFFIQFVGAVICFIWAFGISWITFNLLKKYAGLRVSPQEELAGITFNFISPPEDNDDNDDIDMSEEDLAALLGGKA